MRTIHNAIKDALNAIKFEIKNIYDEDFNLESFIKNVSITYFLDFEFTKPYEPLLALEYIDRYCGDKFEHDYDLSVVEAMFCWVIANENRDILEQYIEELKEELENEDKTPSQQ